MRDGGGTVDVFGYFHPFARLIRDRIFGFGKHNSRDVK